MLLSMGSQIRQVSLRRDWLWYVASGHKQCELHWGSIPILVLRQRKEGLQPTPSVTDAAASSSAHAVRPSRTLPNSAHLPATKRHRFTNTLARVRSIGAKVTPIGSTFPCQIQFPLSVRTVHQLGISWVVPPSCSNICWSEL